MEKYQAMHWCGKYTIGKYTTHNSGVFDLPFCLPDGDLEWILRMSKI